MKRERESEREGVSLRVTRVSSSKPNVTPDVDHSDRCILLHEEWRTKEMGDKQRDER